MPIFKITEQDATGKVQGSPISNTVYFPLKLKATSEKMFGPTLFTSRKQFEAYAIAEELDSDLDNDLLGYNLCNHLLDLGFQVLVSGSSTLETLSISTSEGTSEATSASTIYEIQVGSGIVTKTVDDGAGHTDITTYTPVNGPLNSKLDTYTLDSDIWPAEYTDNDKYKTAGNNDAYKVKIDTPYVYVQKTANEIGSGKWKVTIATYVPNESYLDAIVDKSLYDVRFITAGIGFQPNETNNIDLNQNLITVAKQRGDCVALVSVEEPATYNAAAVKNAFENYANGEFGAGFTPAFKSKNSDLIKDLTDEDYFDSTNKEVIIPACFGYLFAYANAIKNNPEWFAIAGFQRGIIPELSDVTFNLSTADVNLLSSRTELDAENDNVGVAVNPIANIRPAGYILYGNRTLKINDAAKKTTATSFLNVRNAVSMIKKVMYDAARKYVFEPNSETLWINFQSYVTPLLDQMQSGQGILGYKFVKLNTDAKARLKARLYIVPVEAVEDFELEVYLTDDLAVSENG